MSFLPLLIICLSFFAESIFGFGGGLIAIPLLSLLMPVKDSVTIVLIFQLLMGLLIFKIYKLIDWKIALPMTFGLIFGTIFGTYSLASIDDIFLRKFLAISIFVFLIKSIFFNKFNLNKIKGKLTGVISGLIGGIFQGIIGTGGPVFTMYLADIISQKQVFRATLIYLFFTSSIIRVIASFKTELITKELISIILPIIPIFLIALYLGNHIHNKISQKYYDYAIRIILLFSSVSLLLK